MPYSHKGAESSGLGEGFVAVCKFLVRWHLGRPILRFPGQRPTNATFFRRGTKPRNEWDRLSPWAYWPEGVRALIRIWSCELLPFLAVKWWLTGSWTYATLTILTTVAGVGAGGYFGYRAVRYWRHQRRWVRPLHGAVNHVLGMRLPESAIHVPLDFQHKDTKGVVIDLPIERHIDGVIRNSLKACVSQRLALPSPVANLAGDGAKLSLVVTPAPRPPELVRWSELVEAMGNCARGEVVLGLDSYDQVFRGSLKKGNPHWGFSVNTDRGKSTHAQSIVAQILHQDPRNRATYIDKKGMSCAPLRGVPGLNLVEDPDDLLGMWAAVQAVYDDLNARRAAVMADPTAEFGLHLLVLDELSEFSDDSMDLWKQWKAAQDPRWDPAGLPVARHLRKILRTGRQFDIHVVVYTQRLDVRSCFGMPNFRDLLGLRGLGGYKHNQWRMLIGTTPIPPAQKGKGRWIYSDGESESWVQNVYSSDGTDATWETEIKDYAMANRLGAGAYSTPSRAASVPGEVVRIAPAERLYTAAQASLDKGMGIVPMKLSAITSEKHRAKVRGDHWPSQMTAVEWKTRCRKLEVVS